MGKGAKECGFGLVLMTQLDRFFVYLQPLRSSSSSAAAAMAAAAAASASRKTYKFDDETVMNANCCW